MPKAKQPTYKRGDKVVYLRMTDYGLQVTQAEVTATREQLCVNPQLCGQKYEHLVYVKHESANGSIWKYTFSDAGGSRYGYGEKYPLWMLRHMNDSELPNLEKRAKEATEAYQKYKDRCTNIDRQVEEEARKWKWAELEKRKKDVPNGWDYLNRVVARMGFMQPKVKG